MSAQNNMVVEGITAQELNEAITHFERLSNTYFWNPPGSASGRRAEEKNNTRSWDFTVGGKQVKASVTVSCSCRNYYATRVVTVGDVRKKQMVPFLKKCLAAVSDRA